MTIATVDLTSTKALACKRLLVSIALISVVAFTGDVSSARERWTTQEAWSWYNDQPALFGANYVMGYAVSPTEMWQADASTPGADTFDLNRINFELDRAQQAGLNTLRVTLSYEVWKADTLGFMQRLDQFVSAADQRGIRPAFIFWDDVNFTYFPHTSNKDPYLGVQADPTPGVHNSQWTGTGGRPVLDHPGNWELSRQDPAIGAGAKEYIQTIVGQYASDDRVLMWNAYNEPANFGNGVNDVINLIRATADWAREMDPAQPISFDVWGSSADSTARAESDVISYHNYSSPASTISGLRFQLAYGRPVFLTEWMARTFGSTIPDILPDLQEMRVAAYNWGLVNGDQQTHFAWGTWDNPHLGPEPDPWFHDLFRRDGTAYRAEEIAMYQHYRQLDTLLRSADSRLVEIENPSFEADDLGGVPDATAPRTFAGWTITHESGDWVGGTIVPDTGHFTDPLPDGGQAMFAVDIEIAQTLDETLAADTFYVLQVDVGHRVGRTLPEYDFDLYAGGTELSALSTAYSNPVEGQWTAASKIFQAGSGDPLLGMPLEVRLSSTGLETFFDNVRLIAIDSLDEIGVTSDLNRDGVINSADWALFAASAHADLSGLSPAQQFLHGDLDRDGDNDFQDFLLFKHDYIVAHGAQAFAALLAAPEPCSIALLMLPGVCCAVRRARFV
ncbi:MAG: cellulase family glycosylhydrolase [Planctomycetales bacterium]|nr:cellulase family glycosylhydrolase [Planctomycetales bacterium]